MELLLLCVGITIKVTRSLSVRLMATEAYLKASSDGTTCFDEVMKQSLRFFFFFFFFSQARQSLQGLLLMCTASILG